MGTRIVFLPSERIMLSSLTISLRFFLMASLIFSLWRSWSICPLRCSDQSCCETDIAHTFSIQWRGQSQQFADSSRAARLARGTRCEYPFHDALHLAIEQ